MNYGYVFFAMAVVMVSRLFCNTPQQEAALEVEYDALMLYNNAVATQFYAILEKDSDSKDITQLVLESDLTQPFLKKQIAETGRRIFVFQYPSDGLLIKGYISFVPQQKPQPWLMYLRGGNTIFGIPHPALWSTLDNYIVVATTYRGGVSEGEDQYGGDDVNDVENLVKYLPELAQKLSLHVQPDKLYMLGTGRGAKQMFLALGRSPALQQQVTKVISLAGGLDFKLCMQYRPGMVQMFVEEFGLILGQNDKEWVEKRDPRAIVPFLRKDLPFLIIQDTDNLRVNVLESRNMFEDLNNHGATVEYVEIEHEALIGYLGTATNDTHFSINKQEQVDRLITQWLEQ
jgi:dipeptidyl aminopeptidase/acylaminoacyl peptidase